jgi:hypothetical protein
MVIRRRAAPLMSWCFSVAPRTIAVRGGRHGSGASRRGKTRAALSPEIIFLHISKLLYTANIPSRSGLSSGMRAEAMIPLATRALRPFLAGET